MAFIRYLPEQNLGLDERVPDPGSSGSGCLR